MMTGQPEGITFHKSRSPNPGEHHVHHDGVMVGSVAQFRMGAAQFGTTWMATTPTGKTSTRFASREAAASWLVQEARRA